MSKTTVIFAVMLAIGTLYSLIATFVCTEQNEERTHWWCPLCQLLKLATRRFV